MVVDEKHLKGAFDTLCTQGMLLAVFGASIVFSLWNLDYLTDVQTASECVGVIVGCWLVFGSLLLRKVQNEIKAWKKLEETATDPDHLKLKE